MARAICKAQSMSFYDLNQAHTNYSQQDKGSDYTLHFASFEVYCRVHCN